MKRFRPGVSFGDFVVKDSSTRKSRVPPETEADYRRGWLVWLGIVAVFGLVAVRLVQLQVML